MKQAKHQFFHKGVDSQSRADSTMDLRRPDEKNISKWTVEQKIMCRAWLNNCEAVFAAYIKAFRQTLK